MESNMTIRETRPFALLLLLLWFVHAVALSRPYRNFASVAQKLHATLTLSFGFARHWLDGLVVVRLKRFREMEVCHETIGTERCGSRLVSPSGLGADEQSPGDCAGRCPWVHPDQGPSATARQGRGSGREDEREIGIRIRGRP